jgi:hypothetical protein
VLGLCLLTRKTMGGKYADCDFMKMLTTYVMSIMKEYDHVDFREMFMRVMYIT